MNKLGWDVTGRMVVIGAIKIASHVRQNHRFTRDEFAAQYRQAFGHALNCNWARLRLGLSGG